MIRCARRVGTAAEALGRDPVRSHGGTIAAALAAWAWLGGCGSQPPADAPIAPPHAIGIETSGESKVSAGWFYHPPELAELSDGYAFDDGSWLLVGERGERWLTEPLPKTQLSGAGLAGAGLAGAGLPGSGNDTPGARSYGARASTFRAPERLTRVIPWEHPRRPPQKARGWLFLSAGGTLYAADTPLGALTVQATAPHPLIRSAGTTSGLVGLDALGQAHHYADGAWTLSPTSPQLFDVANSAAGQLLGLSMPEALWRSEDGGASWLRINHSVFGGRELVRSEEGGVIVRGAAEDRYWAGADSLTAVTTERPRILPSAGVLNLQPARGPRASAIEQRLGVVSGDRYYEIFAAEGDETRQRASTREGTREDSAEEGTTRWMLARGNLGSALEVRALSLPGGCDGGMVLAAHDALLLLACGRGAGEATSVDILRSSDGGDSFTQVATAQLALTEEVEIAVASDGTTLLAGLCRAPSDDEPCDAASPLRLPAGSTALRSTRAGDLTGSGRAPAFSEDGTRAYFVGHRAKDGRAALFVSVDGGASFSSRLLMPPKGTRGPWLDPKSDDIEIVLAPGADGELGIIIKRDPPVYAVADQDGHVVAVARLPAGVETVHGHGRKIFAVGSVGPGSVGPGSVGPGSVGQGQGSVGQRARVATYESLDAGASFRRVRPPFQLDRDELPRHLGTFCSSGGCVVGDRLTRIAWGGEDRVPFAVGDVPTSPPDRLPAVRDAIVCRLDESSSWSSIDHVASRGDRTILPPAAHAFRGRSDWSALIHDDISGRVETFSAEFVAAKVRLDRLTLLDAVRDRSRFAYYVVPQMEGYAALRVPLPADRTNLEGRPIRNLEVAWVNYMRGERGRARIADAGTFAADHVTPGARPHLMTSLLSVSPAGAFLRLRDDQADTLVLGPGGTLLAKVAYPSWPATHFMASVSEAVLVTGKPIAVGLFSISSQSETSTVALTPLGPTPLRPMSSRRGAQGGAAAWPSFVAVAPPAEGRQVRQHWTYRGAEVGTVVLVLDPQTQRAAGYFTAFTADGKLGAPVPVPTQLDLASSPKGCDDVTRQSTPRVTAPYMIGTRHPIFVADGSHRWLLLSDVAVLHGTPRAPCVAGWHATSVGKRNDISALISGDQSRGWLFRSSAAGRLDYHPLRCEPDPAAAVPPEIWRERGTVLSTP